MLKRFNTRRQFWILSCPFLIVVIGGSFLLSEFIKPRFQLRAQTERVHNEEELNVRKRKNSRFSLQHEYLRLQQDLNIDDWELKPLKSDESRTL